MSDHRLATVETITEIAPIPDADQIVRARVRGWDVVVKKGEFKVGDPCVYFEVDSMLDVQDPRFAFLAPRGVRTDATGRKGHVLKTARLRGQYSQGLALPIRDFPELAHDCVPGYPQGGCPVPSEGELLMPSSGTDVTEALGIVKWDPPIPASLAGQIKGLRPSWVPKTDEERIQNDPSVLTLGGPWVATEKIDGSSVSFYWDNGEFGVCSRNLDLLETEGNTLWSVARQLDVEGWMAAYANDYSLARVVIQGEIFGEGIQANPLKVKGHHFRAFNFHTAVLPGHVVPVARTYWPSWVEEHSVPAYYDLTFPTSVEEALAQVENLKSRISPDRPAEGAVWRTVDTTVGSFKAISNRYLLKADR